MKIFLIGYMFLFIYRPFEIYPILGDIHLERLWMIAALLCFFFSKKTIKHKIYGVVPVLFFFFVIAVSSLVAPDFDLWYKNFESYCKVLVFYFLLASSVDSYQDFFDLILAYVVIMFLYEAKSLYEYLFNGRHMFRMGIKRLMGIDQSGADPNTMANSIVFCLPFAYALYQDKVFVANKKHRYFLLGFMLMSLVCIVMTGSRTGALGICLLGLLVWLQNTQKLKWMLLIIALSTLTWNIMPQEKRVRLESIFNQEAMLEGEEGEKFKESAKESAESRKQGLIDGYKLMQLSPVIGHGMGAYSIVRSRVNSDPNYYNLQAHNMLGQLMGDLGLLGIISFFMFVISIIYFNVKVIKARIQEFTPFSVAILTSLFMMFFNGYAAHNLYRFNWLWFAAFSSILYRLRLEMNRNERI